jgi:hypothetical protein
MMKLGDKISRLDKGRLLFENEAWLLGAVDRLVPIWIEQEQSNLRP